MNMQTTRFESISIPIFVLLLASAAILNAVEISLVLYRLLTCSFNCSIDGMAFRIEARFLGISLQGMVPYDEYIILYVNIELVD